MNVDIIIPIFNALEDLRICLKSIYKYTDLQHNRLILINDQSTDERIKPFLDEQKSKNVIVIHNSTNRGFSNNINLGMEQSNKNDVILLNSDTVVTSRWLEKIVACAYSDRSIGTVTPLSNNATLCSVPNFCEINSLPDDLSIDDAAQIVEDCSLRKYPRITVANGFCMLIKREVIDLIGYFDAEAFGKGYGEENDFCNRAEQMGYIHVMCDDTYIYHSGTKSFLTKEKEDYINEHNKILQKRYPGQVLKNSIYCRDNPNSWIGQNIEYHFAIWNHRRNILYLLQSDFRDNANDNIGGTQLHVKHLTMVLRNNMNVFVAARDNDYLHVTAYIQDKTYPFSFHIGENDNFPVLHSRNIGNIMRQILAGFHIDIVHVHHTATTSLDIFYEAEKLNIPVIFTAHDFYSLCPSVKMLDLNGSICIDHEAPPCQLCLKSKFGVYEKNNFIQMWRQEFHKVLSNCQNIIVPSKSTKTIISKYYMDLQNKIQVIEHGLETISSLELADNELIESDSFVWNLDKIDLHRRCPYISGTAYLKDEPASQYKIILKIVDEQNNCLYLPTYTDINNDVIQSENRFNAYLPNKIITGGKITITAILSKNNHYYVNRHTGEVLNLGVITHNAKFKVAFIGGLNEEKGAKIAADIIKSGPQDVEWYVMGNIGEESLFKLKKENLIKTGVYFEEDLAIHLKYNKINAICILSKWPETFSYTLSEAVINNIPVIVTAAGALEQRVTADGFGSVVRLGNNTANEVISIINTWKNMGAEYNSILQNCMKYKHKSIPDMVKEYELIYNNFTKLAAYATLSTSDLETLCQAYISGTNYDKSYGNLLSQVNSLKSRLSTIENSLTFKMVLKLTSANIPFKNKLKSLLSKQN